MNPGTSSSTLTLQTWNGTGIARSRFAASGMEGLQSGIGGAIMMVRLQFCDGGTISLYSLVPAGAATILSVVTFPWRIGTERRASHADRKGGRRRKQYLS